MKESSSKPSVVIAYSASQSHFSHFLSLSLIASVSKQHILMMLKLDLLYQESTASRQKIMMRYVLGNGAGGGGNSAYFAGHGGCLLCLRIPTSYLTSISECVAPPIRAARPASQPASQSVLQRALSMDGWGRRE